MLDFQISITLFPFLLLLECNQIPMLSPWYIIYYYPSIASLSRSYRPRRPKATVRFWFIARNSHVVHQHPATLPAVYKNKYATGSIIECLLCIAWWFFPCFFKILFILIYCYFLFASTREYHTYVFFWLFF